MKTGKLGQSGGLQKETQNIPELALHTGVQTKPLHNSADEEFGSWFGGDLSLVE